MGRISIFCPNYIFQISGCNLQISVKELDIYKKTATCFYTDKVLDKEVVLTVPISRLQGPLVCQLDRQDLKFLDDIAKQGIHCLDILRM